MKGYFEINYCIYLKGYSKYKFAKESIVNNNVSDISSVYGLTNSKYVLYTFIKLFPILGTFKAKDIEISKCWQIYHPLDNCEIMPTNKYNKDHDEFLTKIFNDERAKYRL